MVVGIAYYLKLYLLPSLQTLLDKYLWCERECRLGNLHERLLVGTYARAKAAQGISRANHDRISYAACRRYGILHSLASLRHWHLQVYLVQLLHKQVAVFCVHDSLNACAEHPYPILLQGTVEEQFRTTVKCRLSAESQQDAVGAFLLDDFGYEISIDGQEIDLVGNTLTCLNCCNVRIDEHRLDAFLTKSLKSLAARVVELASLSNLKRTRTKDEYFL